MKIVFMGTPEFAVASLDAIVKSEHEVVSVVTVPDKPAGRGQQLSISPIKKYAIEKGLPILQPEKLKDPSFLEELSKLNADVFVVVAFRMLPEVVFTMPPKGTFNIHASLLPNYRGAAPIHWAVINGESKTGVTSFFLNKEIDKGDIIASIEVEISDDETTGELYECLMQEGAKLAIDTLQFIEQGNIETTSQADIDESQLRAAPKINKSDTLIDWNRPAKEVYNMIRGLSPFPCAYTRIKTIDDKTQIIKCYKARLSDMKSTGMPGSFSTDRKSNLAVNTLDYKILLENVQIEGKKRMEIGAFLAGLRMENYIQNVF